METISEKLLEKNTGVFVKGLGGLSIKIYSAWFTGLPDRLLLLPLGWLAFVEFKTTGKPLQPRQKIVHKLLTSMGFRVYVVEDHATYAKLQHDILNR